MKIAKVNPSGDVKLFSSIRAAAKDSGLSRNTFTKRLKEDGRVIINDNVHLHLTYYTKLNEK